MKDTRRFTQVKELTPERVWSLGEDHAAVTEGRTLFPTWVVPSMFQERLLVDGRNSRKTGGRIVKGSWKGLPIYTLTLEERATCPKDCAQWRICYGNGMQMARRHSPGIELENLLGLEVRDLIKKHGKIAVRLHILGDFYSVQYAEVWQHLLLKYEGLHIFGFTARKQDSAIGQVIHKLNMLCPERFTIRWSGTQGALGSQVLDFVPKGVTVGDAFVCPAQTGKTACCGTCGLCWSPVMRGRAVALVLHGPTGKRKRWDEDKDTRLTQQWNDGVSTDKISTELGFSLGSIRKRADRLGLPRRMKGWSDKPRKSSTWSEEEEVLFRKLWAGDLPVSQIAKRFGRSPGCMYSKALYMELPTRMKPVPVPRRRSVDGRPKIKKPVAKAEKQQGVRPRAPITLVSSCETHETFVYEPMQTG